MSLSTFPTGAIWRFLLALLPTIVAIAVQVMLRSVVQPHVWYVYFPALFISFWIGGPRIGVVVTCLNAVLIWSFVIGGQLARQSDPGQLIPLALYVATGFLFGLFHGRLISARQTADKALNETQEANRRLQQTLKERQIDRALIDTSKDFIGVADKEGHPLYVNAAARRMVGLSPDFPIEQTRIPDYYPPEQRPFFTEVIFRTLKEQGFWRGETFFRHWQTGEAIPISQENFLIHAPETGEVLGMATITRDIRAIKQLERSLRESVADLNQAQAVAKIGSWRLDVHLNELRWSDETYRIFGIPLGTPMTYESFLALVHPADRAYVESQWAAAQRGEPYDIEHRLVVNGHVKWVREIAHLDMDEDGTILGGIGITQDISAQKRLEQEQRFLSEVGAVLSSSLQYEDTLANIAQLAVRDFADICIIDLFDEDSTMRRLKVASRDHSIGWACDALESLPAGMQDTHLIKPVLDTKRPILLPQLSPQQLHSLVQEKAPLRLLRAMDPKSIMAAPLLHHGKLLGVITLLSTSSTHLYGEADLHLAEDLAYRAALAIDNARLYRQAKQAIQARDDMLGIVAHDLRNPLAVILMQASLLRHLGCTSERDQAMAIERAARRMNRLIQDLLDVIRLEAGHLALNMAPVNATELLADSVAAQAALAATASLHLESSLPSHLPAITGDRDRLLQVFDNLISNAIKFTLPGGRVTVGASPQNGEVLFWVRDTGCGISPEEMPHLFDRFWQARKGDSQGAGLGLPIAKGIIEAHGGRMWVESTPGIGSTFHFTVPVAASPRAVSGEAGIQAS